MSRPVFPDPAGASTIHDWVMSRACSRWSASGGWVVCFFGASTRKSSGMGFLGLVRFGVVVLAEMIQACGIEAAEQPLRAVLAGLRVALGMDAGVAGVEVLGELG